MTWEQDLRLGRQAISSSQLDVAETRLRSALASAKSEFWYPVEELAEIQTSLAEALLLKGSYEEAARLFTESENYFGSFPDQVAGISRAINWYGLAETLMLEEDKQEHALELFKKALSYLVHCSDYRAAFYKRACAHIQKQVNKPDLPWEQAANKSSQELKQITEHIFAREILQPALVNQIEQWELLLDKSRQCLNKGTATEALEGYKLANQAIELAMKLFPLHHAASAITITQMAAASAAMQMRQQAESLYEFAIEIHEILSGKDSVEVALTRLNLAHTYRKFELYNEADIHFRQAAEILAADGDFNKEDLDAHSDIFLEMLADWKASQIAAVQIQEGKELEIEQKLDQALIVFLKAKQLIFQRFPKQHKLSLLVLESTRQVYEKLGWTEQAVSTRNQLNSIKALVAEEEQAWKTAAQNAPALAMARRAA